MDPLSLSASAAGLLSLGLQTVEYLYKFYKSYHNRESNLSRILRKLGDLRQTLQEISDVVNQRRSRPDEQTTLIQHIATSVTHCEDIIYELREESEKFRKTPQSSLKASLKESVIVAGRRTVYPFRQSTLDKLGEDVDEFRDQVSVVLQALDLKEHQNTQNDVADLSTLVKNLQALHISSNVRQWLNAPDATINYNSACNKCHQGTGQWLIRGPEFTSWLQQSNSLLWIYGFAGCGKSVLCSTAIQHTLSLRQADAGIAVAFFFFTFTEEAKQGASAALRALLLQLSTQVVGLESELEQLYRTYGPGTPTLLVLWECLRTVIARFSDVYIIFDALDENIEETARNDVLSMLENMRQWHVRGLHLLVTSRDDADIRGCMRSQQNITNTHWISLKNASVDEDIQNFISYSVDYDKDLQEWKGPLRQQIKEYLCKHAGGVFKWAECQLESLKRKKGGRTERYLRSYLNALPKTLGQTYERILCAIDQQSQDDAQRILSLLCYAQRPLFVGEIIEAISVDIDDRECYDVDRRLDGAEDLLRICSGLIEIYSPFDTDEEEFSDEEMEDDYLPDNKPDDIVSVSTSINDEENCQMVRIAHFSIQEYLTSLDISEGDAKAFAMSDLTEHARISKTCLLYLSDRGFVQQVLTARLLERYEFADYAARYWPAHFQEADKQLKTLLYDNITFLLSDGEMFDRLRRLFDVNRPWEIKSPAYGSDPEPPFPIYYAAITGLNELLEHLLSKSSATINVRGKENSTALQVAAHRNHAEVVQTLIKAGAEINAEGGFVSGTALQFTSFYGNEQLVHLLLSAGAEVDTHIQTPSVTALQGAALNGHMQIVLILIEAGADVNARGDLYGSALQAASESGHTEIVQILLDEGAEVDLIGGKHYTALQAASVKGHAKIVKLLLEEGADVNLQGGENANALQAASTGGHKEVVLALIEAGADVSVGGGFHCNPLRAASVAGHAHVVQVLLDNGAQENAPGGRYTEALWFAAGAGEEQTVRVLINGGANVHGHLAPGFGTPLHAACVRGIEGIVRALLEAGADMNAQGGYHGSAIQEAFYSGNEEITKLLLEAGARVDPEWGLEGLVQN